MVHCIRVASREREREEELVSVREKEREIETELLKERMNKKSC